MSPTICTDCGHFRGLHHLTTTGPTFCLAEDCTCSLYVTADGHEHHPAPPPAAPRLKPTTKAHRSIGRPRAPKPPPPRPDPHRGKIDWEALCNADAALIFGPGITPHLYVPEETPCTPDSEPSSSAPAPPPPHPNSNPGKTHHR